MLPSSSTLNFSIFLASFKKSYCNTANLTWWSLFGVLLLMLQWPLQTDKHKVPLIDSVGVAPNGVKNVVIGLVSCPLASGQNSKLNEEAGVTIKSIVMSARMYGLESVEFHIFLENTQKHKTYFLDKLREFGVTGDENDLVQVRMKFHSAFDIVPKQYHEGMVYHPTHRCGFVRMFFPSALPEVDSILYLDTDMIVTGNIGKLWEKLGQMKNEQLIGVARNNEPEDGNYGWLDKQGFGDIPHVAPKGVNSGMLLMNLTRMREYGWEEKITRVFRDYGKIVMLNDQRLLNILLYFDPGLLYLIPCQFDLMHTHCDQGWICPAALTDSYGVQMIHGANDMFDEGKSFYPIYKMYLEANATGEWERDENMFQNMVRQIKSAYLPTADGSSSKCFGTLNKLLYKNFA